MPQATLAQILDAREKRVELQKRLISSYKTSLASDIRFSIFMEILLRKKLLTS